MREGKSGTAQRTPGQASAGERATSEVRIRYFLGAALISSYDRYVLLVQRRRSSFELSQLS
jgi:hypothetical protein